MLLNGEIASPMLPQPFRVVGRQEEIPGCVALTLESVNGAAVHFSPGQFYMVYVFGQGEVPISVSGDPACLNQLTFTVMSVGSVTRALCSVEPGECLGLRGPFGSAWPVDKLKGKDVVIMAGGLGLAPLRPALYQLLRNHSDYETLRLLYGTRQPQSILFHQQLVQWKAHAPIEVEITVDTAGQDWLGKVGVVTDLLKRQHIDPNKSVILICGPEVMMRFSAYALLDLGVPSNHLYLSMERNMKCAVKLCGRCQFGPYFICNDEPIFSFDRVEHLFKVREV